MPTNFREDGTFDLNLAFEQLSEISDNSNSTIPFPTSPRITLMPSRMEAFGTPFLDNGGWYVVFEYEDVFVGTEMFSPSFHQYYRITEHVPEMYADYPFSYRAEWLPNEVEERYYDEEPEHIIEINDGYSEEREEPLREIVPTMATNIGRDIPLISFEQEFVGDGDKVAKYLYDAGLSFHRYADGYHSSEGRNFDPELTDKICYVETDSSCGYEVIFDRLNLTRRSVAEKVSIAQRIMRELKDNDSIRLSARCGFHIHVDVNNWGMKEIVSAYHLWNYLEDPIFRFASAFWTSHRDEEVGGGYSTPVPKGETQRKGIANRLYDRRDALNFSHILRAKTNCNCGAYLYEDWANCECNLRQPTLEFRVFNATLNQRKIRAYISFCVAFVNLAKNMEFNPTDFPEMRWRGTSFSSHLTWEENAGERVKFIFDNFPITNAEKNDILYCMKNSSLDKIVENF